MIDVKTSIPATTEYQQKWIDGLNRGDVSAADESFHPDCIIHINGNAQREISLEGFKQMLSGFLAAFPDLHFIVNDTIIAGNKVGIRWTATGTNTGALGELQPTGKTIEVEGLIIDQVRDGRVETRWEIWDQMAMFQQLGLA